MTPVVDGRRVEMEKTERPMAKSSRGRIQRPETNDDRRPTVDRRNDGTCVDDERSRQRPGRWATRTSWFDVSDVCSVIAYFKC